MKGVVSETNRKHIQQFIEDFRLTRTRADDKLDSQAQYVRDLTIAAVKSAKRPLTLSEVHKSIADICMFSVRWEFFLSSICTRMGQTGIVIADGKVYLM